MAYQDNSSHLNPLAQIPLTKSPFVHFPQAVTLPYTYKKAPTISSIPDVPVLPAIQYDNQPVEQLKAQIEAAKARVQQWEIKIKERELKNARKLAPGFLDTGVTMLTPTKVASSVPVKAVEPPIQTDLKDQFDGLRFD